MATSPASEPTLDIREQLVRIDKMQAELNKIQVEITRNQVEMARSNAEAAKANVDVDKTRQEMRFAPWTIVTTALGAGAALFAAGAAFTKLLLG